MQMADTKGYFKVLDSEFPAWLDDYINTKELQTQKYISVTCGTIYSDLFAGEKFYSSLDHSVAVSLIIWHFTHDKRQALAGLFHDVATPAFKHCIDFLNEDHISQESTESLTSDFINKSADVAELLDRDRITLAEIADYHIYPIADNDAPKLSADRLEYTLANALFTYQLLTLPEIKELYDDIEIEQNEDKEIELGFKTKALARKFTKISSQMSVLYRDDKSRFSMQFIADLLKRLQDEGKITTSQLYDLKESEIIKIIENSKFQKAFQTWRKSQKINISKTPPKGVYYVHQKAKIRYIDPLCNNKRISTICKIAKKAIDKNLSYDMDNYVFLDFTLE